MLQDYSVWELLRFLKQQNSEIFVGLNATLEKMFEKSYNFFMDPKLVTHLAEQPVMRVLDAFIGSSEPRYLRELVTHCDLSPGGVSDILARLSELGVLRESTSKNRKLYTLHISAEERSVLSALFVIQRNSLLKERAKKLSQGAAQKLRWMDESYQFFRSVKGDR